MSSKREFVGCEALKAKQAQQLAVFENRVAQNNFSAIHRDHFDWWMFPIDEKSSYGYQYSVSSEDVEKLKSDSEFMKNYLRGVEILFLAYGWQINDRHGVTAPAAGQSWQNYPVRLFKCVKSLQLFGCTEHLASARLYVESIGFGSRKAVDSELDDGKRIIKILELPGHENITMPSPRYK